MLLCDAGYLTAGPGQRYRETWMKRNCACWRPATLQSEEDHR